MAAKRRKKKMSGKKKAVIVIFEILILMVILTVLFVMQKISKIDSGNKIVKGEGEGQVQTNELPQEAQEVQTGYKTIAFFGLDNRESNHLDQGNSDVIIVASIDQATKDIKMASIYRDTYLNLTGGDGYNKCNAAYAYGGPSQAVSMLNVNFDLDIDEYVTFDFNAVTDAVDMLGGVEIEVTDEEVSLINGYIEEVADITGKDPDYMYEGGVYNLSGVQATAYARIRYTTGDDYKRTERQRLVVQKMMEKAQSSDLLTINSLVDAIFPEVKTSLTSAEILLLAKDAFSYRMADNAGFPQDKWAGMVGGKSVVVACDLAGNVKLLHQFLFGEQDFHVSDRVQEISDEIVNETGIDASMAGY